MTLPASGTITAANFNTELGQSSGASISLSFIYGKAKTGQQYYNFSSYYSHAYYQQNTAGNCSNGNCTATNCNCIGAFQCQNCSVCSAVNCTNCDAQSYLQTNCNCSSGYNCSLVANILYDCNSNCTGRC